MRIVSRDQEKREQEQKQKEINKDKEEKRRMYLERLTKQKQFQEYVVDGIIKKNLDFLTDLRNIKNADFNNMEEVGKLVLQTKAARTTLERILADLIN